ncbi:MAG: hypothetical protein WBX15_05430 [Thermoanaerobaculia bacterium]
MQKAIRTNVIIGAVCLILGVVAGAFAGAWLERRQGDERMAAAVEAESARAGQLEARMSRLQERIDLTGIQLRLGRLAMEADRQDYGTAGEQATTFFDDVARTAQKIQGDEKAKAALQHVLAARDEVTAGLAKAQPAAAQRLKQLYLDFSDMAP